MVWWFILIAATNITLALLILNTEHALSTRIDRHTRKVNTMVQAAIDTITAQLNKASAEIVAKIDELQTANPDVDLSELKAVAQRLDDIVPDQPEDEDQDDDTIDPDFGAQHPE